MFFLAELSTNRTSVFYVPLEIAILQQKINSHCSSPGQTVHDLSRGGINRIARRHKIMTAHRNVEPRLLGLIEALKGIFPQPRHDFITIPSEVLIVYGKSLGKYFVLAISGICHRKVS